MVQIEQTTVICFRPRAFAEGVAREEIMLHSPDKILRNTMYELLYLILYCVPPIVIGTLIVHYLYGGDTNLKMVFGTQLFLCIAMTSWFLFCAVDTYPEGVGVHIFLVLAILYSFSLTIKTFKKHHRQ